MLAGFMNSPHFPSELKRLALKAALEIGFLCDSSPFWLFLGDVLKVRETELMSEKQKADGVKDAEEERKKKELEVHSMRMEISVLKDSLANQQSILTGKDEEISKFKAERADYLTKIDTIGKQFLLLQSQQQQLIQQTENQKIAHANHVKSLEESIRKAQQDVAFIQSQNKELTDERITVSDMHEYMVAIAKFCNVKPPAKKAAIPAPPSYSQPK